MQTSAETSQPRTNGATAGLESPQAMDAERARLVIDELGLTLELARLRIEELRRVRQLPAQKPGEPNTSERSST